jgi:hypothetical protein
MIISRQWRTWSDDDLDAPTVGRHGPLRAAAGGLGPSFAVGRRVKPP